jgi:predicted metal-dependent peptidase
MFNLSNSLTPIQRVQKAVVAIMHNKRYRALSGVLMVGSRSIATSMNGRPNPTAMTNGRDEVYNPDFVNSLTDSELRFLVLHESYHKLYRHLVIWLWMYKRHAEAANIACDHVINIKLVDDNVDGFATMTGPLASGCFDDKYRGWDSARVFQDLMKNATKVGGGGGGEPGGEGFDSHDWDGAQEMSADDKQALAREIDGAIRQGALMAGKTGSGGDRDFDELLQPKVDWRTAMRAFVTATCSGADYTTWRKPNRRYVGEGIYMPSGVTETVKEVAIGVDASGSTYAPGVLTAFMSEVKGILESVRPEKVHLIYWDTEVCGHETYNLADLDNIMTSTKPKGGGGTAVECVPKFMAENDIRPQAVIVLTDGHLGGSWGAWLCPVLWCILDNNGARPDNGTAIHIEQHDM